MTLTHGDPDAPRVVVMLHGREMAAADLAPFAPAIGADYVVVPDAPDRTWYPFDELRRASARARLGEICASFGERPVTLVGFSSGGMLAMDAVLSELVPNVRALALLSSIAFPWFRDRGAPLAGMPILVTHGRADRVLPFAAGEVLRDFATASGATVTWLPFDGIHEIPMVVWRAVRRFVQGLR